MSHSRPLALTCLCLALGCQSGPDRSTVTGHQIPAFNLLIVTLDTTRADRLGAYGFGEPVTPNLDRLASEGVLFRQTTTSAPLTLPAHCSLFTGLNPPRHGVRDNAGSVLAPPQTTLAEELHDQGFRTGAFVASYVLDASHGLNQGFDAYVDDMSGPPGRTRSDSNLQIPGSWVVSRAIDWIARTDRHRFFAWIHFYDPHAPYEPPEPYRTTFAGRPYLGEIAFMDEQVGRLRSFLEGRGLLDRTVILVVGDHGESLGEHGEAMHGLFVYESVLHVPFIIRLPAPYRISREVAALTRTIDVMPTTLDLLGLRVPRDIDGVSLVPLMTGTARHLELEAYSESMYPRYHFGWSDLHALRSDRMKLVMAPKPELYDLAADPDERTNLYEQQPALAHTLASRLASVQRMAVNPDSTPKAVDRETAERLRALGYLGAAADTTARNQPRLADPKDTITLYNRITRRQPSGGYQ